MKTFSQRKGLRAVSEIVQVGGMNDDLRNGLWNVLDLVIWSADNFMWGQYGPGDIQKFSHSLWFHHFKKPVDTRPDDPRQILTIVRERFFKSAWNEVYDLLEFIVQDQRKQRPRLAEFLNVILERELAGYSALPPSSVALGSRVRWLNRS
jgi:AbiJ N-terminal domain 4